MLSSPKYLNYLETIKGVAFCDTLLALKIIQ